MGGKLLKPDDKEWIDFLGNKKHDFYHKSRYLQLCAKQEEAEVAVVSIVEAGNLIYIPILLLPVPGTDYWDAKSPYGYPGPLFLSSENVWDFYKVEEELKSLLINRGIVSLFIRCHPLLKMPDDFYKMNGVIQHTDTVYIDLDIPLEESFMQMKKGLRYDIRKARKDGIQKVFVNSDWSYYNEFIQCYHDTMNRVNASEYYFFSSEYFYELKEALSESLILMVNIINDELASASLFVETEGIVQYHLSCTKDKYKNYNPSKLILDEARIWAHSRGNHRFHLGGGAGSNEDNLFKFKSKYSPARSSFHTWRMIINEPVYEKLVNVKGMESVKDEDRLSGFFPAYRKPTI